MPTAPTFEDITGIPTTTVSSAEAMKALVHPLRLRLLGLLRRDGPATASSLGRVVDESSGATSYHLRQLARYGFVELDADQPNRRDKRWRATSGATSIDVPSIAGDPGAMAALERLVLLQLERFTNQVVRFSRRTDEHAEAWFEAALSSDASLRATPDMLRALRAELIATVNRWREAGEQLAPDDPDAATVSVYLGAVEADDEDLL